MKLFLVRHGDAVSETVDPHRPLSPQGRGEVRTTADFLKSHKYSMKTFFHSTKMRARQTAEIIRDTLCREGMLVEKKYLSPNDAIDRISHDIQNADQDLLIAGHMPFLSRLASFLLNGDAEVSPIVFPTGGVIVLARQNQQWVLCARYPSDER